MTSNIIGFLLGLLWLQQQAHLPDFEQRLLLLAAAILLMAALYLLRRWSGWRLPLLCLLGGVCAVLWGSWRADMRLADTLPAALEGVDQQVNGTISAMPQKTERGWRFEFVVDEPSQVPRHIALAWYDMGFRDGADLRVPPLHVGDRWQLTIRLRRPHGTLNPYGFDYEAWLFEHGLRATGYVRPRGEQRRLEEGSASYFIERSRAAVRTRFEQTLNTSPDGAPYAGVLIALAVGDQQAVPRSQWDVFARTGITHLVSISGLHITMLAGLAYALVSVMWRRWPRLMLYLPAQRAAVLGGLVAAGAYCLLAGFAVPAQRTLCMLAVVAGALWGQRNPAPRDVLALALLLVVLLDPWAVMVPGFWLSFGAVALLFYVGNGYAADTHWLRQWGRAQWAMSIGMLPLLLILFQQFSLVSPIANAIAIPLVSFVITPLTLLATIPGLEFLLHPAHALMAGLMWLMQWLAALPGSAWQQAAAPLPLTLLAVAGGIWLLLPRGVPVRWLGLLPLAALLLWTPSRPAVGDLRATVLDVGQGLAVHVQTAGHDLLFDTGPAFSDEADSGNRIILPYLRAVGVGMLERLVVSHADLDHSGGAESVVDGIAVDRMLTSVPFENHLAALPVAQGPCVAGDAWEWDGVKFEFLHPLAADYEKEGGKSNDMSCVLKVTSVSGSILLTGDIEARSEAQLIARAGSKLHSDVLLVPHHGSRTSSTPEFVTAVGADEVIIPVGYQNRFHHPHPAVLARYQDVQLYRTDRDGAVTVEYSAGKMRTSTIRESYRRYWQQ